MSVISRPPGTCSRSAALDDARVWRVNEQHRSTRSKPSPATAVGDSVPQNVSKKLQKLKESPFDEENHPPGPHEPPVPFGLVPAGICAGPCHRRSGGSSPCRSAGARGGSGGAGSGPGGRTEEEGRERAGAGFGPKRAAGERSGDDDLGGP